MGLADILFKGKAKAAVDEDLNEIFKTSAGPSNTNPRNVVTKTESDIPSNDEYILNETTRVIKSNKRKRKEREEDAASTEHFDEPQGDENNEEDSNGEVPVHVSLLEGSSKRTLSTRKQVYTPEGETKEQRDRRTVFVGNVPAQVAISRPLLKKLKQHIIAYVPDAVIESVRLRSIAFKNPTAPLSDVQEKPSKLHSQTRAEKWREAKEEKDGDQRDVKVYLTPNQKRKLAFIKGEVHEQSPSIHAYVVFAYPIPGELRPKNTSNKTVLDPFKAAQVTVEQCNGSSFLDHTLRVDFVNRPDTLPENPIGSIHTVDTRLSIFVGNVDFSSTEEDLRAFFESLIRTERGARDVGERVSEKTKAWVTKVRIVRDRDTQLGKGFAYIQFADRDCVDEVLALEQGKLRFAKRKLRVQKCKIVPNASDGKRETSKRPQRDIQAPRGKSERASHVASAQVYGDPQLGERIAGLSKEMRKKIKSTEPDRVARRLAKKKARLSMKRDGTKTKARVRERKHPSQGKSLNSGRKGSKARVRSDRAMTRKNFKKL